LGHTRNAAFRLGLDSAFAGARLDFALRGDAFMTAGAAEFRTDLTRRFEKDAAAEAQLDKSLRLDSVRQEDFDTVFLSGRPRSDVGSRRGQALHQVDRVLPCCR
jgi:hypothetical protein